VAQETQQPAVEEAVAGALSEVPKSSNEETQKFAEEYAAFQKEAIEAAKAKDAAKVEGEKMIEAARHSIAMEKVAAIDDMKKQISSLSVDIAETILKKKLDNKDAQNDLVANLLNDKNLN